MAANLFFCLPILSQASTGTDAPGKTGPLAHGATIPKTTFAREKVAAAVGRLCAAARMNDISLLVQNSGHPCRFQNSRKANTNGFTKWMFALQFISQTIHS